ncbi:MAG: DUF523 domain-containing protein [Anaeroplasma sp.]
MENILVSSCLLGYNTKYNGKSNYNEKIEELKSKYNLILVCPEVVGGLSIPRLPSEIKDNRVININNEDVTINYNKGANIALLLVKKYNIKKAVLKEKSPSCGSNTIYDGSFSGTKINGMGVTARLLKEYGVEIFSENNFDELI